MILNVLLDDIADRHRSSSLLEAAIACLVAPDVDPAAPPTVDEVVHPFSTAPCGSAASTWAS